MPLHAPQALPVVETTETLRSRLLSLGQYLERLGLKIPLERAASWEHFQSLNLERQNKILKHFTLYDKIVRSNVKRSSDITDSKRLTRKALSRLKLRLSRGAEKLIRDDYVIEIYDFEGFQLFRSFTFLECVSYSFSDLLVYEWHELFRRPGVITDKLLEHFSHFASGRADYCHPVPSDCPLHVIEEIFSESHNKALIEQKELLPLFGEDSQSVEAVLILIKAELIEGTASANLRTLDRQDRSRYRA